MTSALLVTKVHLPVKPPKLIRRLQVTARLNEGLDTDRQLILVSAPAGFGKTTCVVGWLDELKLPVAWLSLDAFDDDPGRFFTYFMAALQQINTRLGYEIIEVLSSGQLPSIDSMATALIDDILNWGVKFIFVLDDFQVLQDQAILKFLERLIANQPPQLHLVLITREDPLLPLARLRANNKMTEVRANDLHFSGSEITHFIREVMGLSLSEEDITNLEARTEGWIAGVQLAGLSLRGRKDPSSFISSLTGNNRYIMSYLMEEVLNQQPEDVQAFLLQTSLLDRLNGDLCDAITGRADSNLLLEHLLNANLFVIPLDDEQHWYRYHPLFADLLRTMQKRAASNQVAQLHQLASQWFVRAGMSFEAIEHALGGEDYQQAVNLIEQSAMEIVMQGYFKTVERWFQALPPEWHTKSPRANLALAGMHLMRGNYPAAGYYLDQAEPALFSSEFITNQATGQVAMLQSEWLALRANVFNAQGNASEGLELAQKVIQIAHPGDDYIQGLAYLGLGGAYRLMDDYPRLVEAYQAAIQHSRAAGNVLSETMSGTALALTAIQHGKLHFAQEVTSQMISRHEASGSAPPPVAGTIYGVLGLVHYEWNELESARIYLLHGLQLSLLGGHNAGIVYIRLILARLNQAQGDLEGTEKNLQEVAELLPRGIPVWLLPEVTLQQVHSELARGNLPFVETLISSQDLSWSGSVSREQEIYFMAYLELILHRARQDTQGENLADAIRIATKVIHGASQGGRISIALNGVLLRAQLYFILGDSSSALNDFELALEWGEPEGYVRTFIDKGPEVAMLLRQSLHRSPQAAYAKRLLDACMQKGTATDETEFAKNSSGETQSNPLGLAVLVEPLTDREREVLQLMAEGLKYKQIAEKLVISLNTVRFYVKEIYSKLQVNNRTRAIDVARQFNLL